jgi:peptide-methionine (R)-S-oxide reductase
MRANSNITTDRSSLELRKPDEQWRAELTPQQYDILRRRGPEPPFTGEYVYNKGSGSYRCAACGSELFDSGAKFDSGTGWPSFTEPAVADAVELRADNGRFMRRTEVVCRRCGGHLGHVFADDPGPTRERYASTRPTSRLSPCRLRIRARTGPVCQAADAPSAGARHASGALVPACAAGSMTTVINRIELRRVQREGVASIMPCYSHLNPRRRPLYRLRNDRSGREVLPPLEGTRQSSRRRSARGAS